MLTPAQNKELGVLTTMLDRFFGTDGLYGHSAPSTTPKAFVATLQEEADLGTLSVVTNHAWATSSPVTCSGPLSPARSSPA